MAFVKILNNKATTYPYSLGQLRRDNPNVSFPKSIPDEMLSSYGVKKVFIASEPSFDVRTQTISENALPSLIGEEWVLGWAVSDKTEEEIEQYDQSSANSNRSSRNSLLQQTDWMALSDVTITAEMTAYRQALRDITNHANWPNLQEADWPVKP